jgi:hypothetical protein
MPALAVRKRPHLLENMNAPKENTETNRRKSRNGRPKGRVIENDVMGKQYRAEWQPSACGILLEELRNSIRA